MKLAAVAKEAFAGPLPRGRATRDEGYYRAKLAALAVVAGCQGTVGTVDVTLATSPGSTILATVQTLRLTLTDPPEVQTAQRVGGGFAIDLQLPATGNAGALIVDGLDASGNVIASGASPPFPFGAVTASVVVFMAAPNSISTDIVTLDPPRTQISSTSVPYGAVYIGGTLGDGTPSAATAIYNAFDHAFQAGVSLPVAKTGAAIAVGSTGEFVYVFGGADASGAATDTVQRFDTSVSPAGSISDFGAFAGYARTGQAALSIGSEILLVTGSPVAQLDGSTATVTTRNEVASLPPSAAAVTASDGVATAIFAGASGVERFRNNTFDALDVPAAACDGAITVALTGGKIGVLCASGLTRIDAAAGTAESFPIPSEMRTGCAVAATPRYLVIAGGTNATGVATTAEIYDATTLALVATQPLSVPRTGATATVLPNGQILIAGGSDASGAPIGTLELFTPDSPP